MKQQSSLRENGVHAVWIAGKQMHDKVAALSMTGVDLVTPGSGHYIQNDAPSTVISAVDEVVDQARYKYRGPVPTLHKPRRYEMTTPTMGHPDRWLVERLNAIRGALEALIVATLARPGLDVETEEMLRRAQLLLK
jgi:hypothetical protein